MSGNDPFAAGCWLVERIAAVLAS